MFRKRGVSSGDIVYIVSVLDGILLLGGSMTVDEVVSRAELVRRRNSNSFFDVAEWIVAKPGTGTRLDLHREIDPALTRKLLVASRNAQPKHLFFRADDKLDGQTTRGIREITAESAELLNQIISVTDRVSRATSMIRVTEELLKNAERPR